METPPLKWVIDPASLSSPASHDFAASQTELTELAGYLGLETVHAFKAKVRVKPLAGGRYKVDGSFEARLTQLSVVDLAPIDTEVKDSFSVEYAPGGASEFTGGSISPEEDLPEALENGRIEIGRLLCEILALAVDPYPRQQGQSFEWQPAEGEGRDGPFAELARLRRPENDG